METVFDALSLSPISTTLTFYGKATTLIKTLEKEVELSPTITLEQYLDLLKRERRAKERLYE